MDTTQRLDTLLARLKSLGHRMTPQRVAILRALVGPPGHPGHTGHTGHPSHPSVDELHRALLPLYPTMSLATVYKTVALLKELGEVLELGAGESGHRYDGHRIEPHPHLICTRCGAVVDPDPASDAALKALVDELARQSGFTLQRHRLDIFGLCPACRRSA